MKREPKIGYCESCSTDDVEVTLYEGDPGVTDRDLCEFCAGTIVGNLTRPHRSASNREVAIAMVQLAHILIGKIAAVREPGPAPSDGGGA